MYWLVCCYLYWDRCIALLCVVCQIFCISWLHCDVMIPHCLPVSCSVLKEAFYVSTMFKSYSRMCWKVFVQNKTNNSSATRIDTVISSVSTMRDNSQYCCLNSAVFCAVSSWGKEGRASGDAFSSKKRSYLELIETVVVWQMLVRK